MLRHSEGLQISFGDVDVRGGSGCEASFGADEIISALTEIDRLIASVDWRFCLNGRALTKGVEVYIGDFDDAPGRAELGFFTPSHYGEFELTPSRLILSRSLRREALWWTLVHYGAHLAVGYAMLFDLNSMNCDSSYPAYEGMTADKFLERFKKKVRSSASWRERYSEHGALWRGLCRRIYRRRVSRDDLICPPYGWSHDSPVHAEGLVAVHSGSLDLVGLDDWRGVV